VPQIDSPFFQYREFAPHGRTDLHPRARRAVRELVATWLHPMRVRFGRCTVHSGARTPGHNEKVGGAPGSKHLYSAGGQVAAADVSFAQGTPQQWAAYAESLDERCGLGVYPGHLHIDNRGTAARW
jgi:hypothetical protein